jgi:hypothetical protein
MKIRVPPIVTETAIILLIHKNTRFNFFFAKLSPMLPAVNDTGRKDWRLSGERRKEGNGGRYCEVVR